MRCGPTLMDPVHRPEFKSIGVTYQGVETFFPSWMEDLLHGNVPTDAIIKEYWYDI